MNEELKCPICGTKLSVLPGFNRDKDGNSISTLLSCPSLACPAQEVIGHGRNYKEAYQIILEKYKK